MGDGDNAPRSLPNPTSGEQSTGGPGPAADVLFDALANRTRRRVAWYLLDESHASLDELADVLAGWELAEADVVDATRRDRIACGLDHVHLPKLAEAGVVEYDRDAGTVSLAALPETVEELARFAYEYDRAAGGPRPEEHRDG